VWFSSIQTFERKESRTLWHSHAPQIAMMIHPSGRMGSARKRERKKSRRRHHLIDTSYAIFKSKRRVPFLFCRVIKCSSLTPYRERLVFQTFVSSDVCFVLRAVLDHGRTFVANVTSGTSRRPSKEPTHKHTPMSAYVVTTKRERERDPPFP